MGLSKLKPIRSDGIEFIDQRSSLYYNKFQYRARFYCNGIYLVWFCNKIEDLNKRYKNRAARFKNVSYENIKNFFNWKLENEKRDKESRATIRMENDTVSVFSNDLNYLKTLEGLGSLVDYTEVDNSIPEGIKYFKNEPKHKYRVHLKSKRVKDDFAIKLAQWIDKYKGTSTVISPSNALDDWLNLARQQHKNSGVLLNNWRLMWTSGHYFIDYNEESTLTLFMLMFDGIAYKKFKLLKHPD